MTTRTGMTNIRWIILGLCLAASFVSYFLRLNFSIVAESMMSDLGFSDAEIESLHKDRVV